MCLVAVGDLDPASVFSLAEEVLPKESGPAIPRDYGRETDLTPLEAEVSCEMEVSMPTFLLGFKCPLRQGQGLHHPEARTRGGPHQGTFSSSCSYQSMNLINK